MPSPKTKADNLAKPNVDIEAIAEGNRQSVHAMAEMNQRMYRAMLSVQSEILDFTQRRLAEDVATARKLAECKEPQTAVKIVHGFQVKALEDYTREASELMRLGAAATSDWVQTAKADPTEDASETPAE